MDDCSRVLIVSHHISHNSTQQDGLGGSSSCACEQENLITSIKITSETRPNTKACSFVTVIDSSSKNIGSRGIVLNTSSGIDNTRLASRRDINKCIIDNCFCGLCALLAS